MVAADPVARTRQKRARTGAENHTVSLWKARSFVPRCQPKAKAMEFQA